MKLYLGTSAESKEGKCFFCGDKIDIDRGQRICSIDIQRSSLRPEIGNHVCRSCGSLTDSELENKINERIESIRSKANKLNSIAEKLNEKKEEGDIERVWRPSFFE